MSHGRGPDRAALLSAALLCCGGCGSDSETPRTVPESRALPPALEVVARALADGRLEEARRLAREHLEAQPRDAQAALLLALALARWENHGAARPWFERALELDPGLDEVHDPLGYSLFLLGELEAARRAFERAIASDPSSPRPVYRVGLIDLEEGRLDQATARFRRAIELFEELRRRDERLVQGREPELASYHARLGDVHFARDEYQAARAELEIATRLAPENVSAYYTLGLVYRRLGEDLLATEALRRYEAGRRAVLSGEVER